MASQEIPFCHLSFYVLNLFSSLFECWTFLCKQSLYQSIIYTQKKCKNQKRIHQNCLQSKHSLYPTHRSRNKTLTSSPKGSLTPPLLYCPAEVSTMFTSIPIDYFDLFEFYVKNFAVCTPCVFLIQHSVCGIHPCCFRFS